MLTTIADLCLVRQVRSDRRQALASHHFLVEVVVDVRTDRNKRNENMKRKYQLDALKKPEIQTSFYNSFQKLAQESMTGCRDS